MRECDRFTGFARDGDLISLKKAMHAGYDPDTPNSAGATAIELAAEFGHTEIVQFLAESGASPNPMSEEPVTTALISAAEEGNTEIMRVLLEHGALPNLVDKGYEQTALIWASAYGYPAAVEMLLEYGADKTIKDVHGNDALTLAQHFGHTSVVRLLSQAKG